MPFTAAHPAIILPLTYLPGKWISLTGLVIGSMTPDFEYFLRMSVQSDYSHTLDGIFWFDLPLGLLLAFIFHKLVRNPLLDNLPAFLRSRFWVWREFDWVGHFIKNWWLVLASLLIGAASHLFWDSFTHNHAYFVERISVLTGTVEFFGYQVPVYKVLQHGSTLIGGLIIAFAIYRLPADKTVQGKVSFRYWWLIGILTLFIIAIRLLTGLKLEEYANVIVSAIAAGLLSLVIISGIFKIENR